MKDQNGSEKKMKKKMSKEKRFYLFTAIGCAAVLVAIIVLAVVISGLGNVEAPTAGKNSIQSSVKDSTGSEEDKDTVGGETSNEPVINTPEGMIMPLETVSVVNDYGFYHNKTLNNYYEHKGVDFTAEVGTDVLAADDGVVESIYRDDVLTGTEIVINHGEGVKTLYRFVEVADNLAVGAEVTRGQVIATVAEATGEEYKDGAHLHFEVKKNGESVDPATYLTFEEK